MSAEAKPTAAPPPVFARRHVKPQYLAPGQHLKVASRKPHSKTVEPACHVPRDPWETEEDTLERGTHTPDAPSPPATGAAAASTSTSGHFVNGGGGGGEGSCRSPLSRPSTGGHPFSAHLSRSRSSIVSDTSPTKEENASATSPAHHHHSNSGERGGDNDGVESDEEENYYHVAAGTPPLTAAERAKQVIEMQQRALELKQLHALTQQGVARRPKTLVRNRHGRLQAITAASPATTAEAPTPQITDAPVTMKAKPRPKASRRAAAPAATEKKKTVTRAEVGRGGDDDLVDSQPSTPTRKDAARLDIDLD